ncbi:MAG: ABC transporter substrate-binding protein [Methanocorpusculum sp.]|nr:ABC transporter substrate-binding protein [Methanocorpusculum sp.]
MKHLTGVLVLLLMLTVCCAGAASAEETRTFTDDLGRALTLPVNISAVSPSGPLAQIVLYSMSPECFVSVSSKVDDAQLKYLDPRIGTLPVTGQFYGAKSTMNAEQIMAMDKELNIDLVLDIGEQKKSMKEDLDTIQSQTGVNFAFVTQNTLSDIAPSYLRLGDLLNMPEQGQNLSTYVDNLLKEFDAGMQKIGDKKVSMIYVTKVDGNAVSLIGSGTTSYHGEVINYLTENSAAASVSSSGTGDTYSMEDILALDPDFIIVAWDAKHAGYTEITNNEMWKTLRAVKNGNVYEAPYGPYSWMGGPPSVHRLLSLMWLGNLFYPDVFNYDLQTKVTEFYSLFFHYNLSASEYADLTKYSLKTPEATTAAKTPAPLAGVFAGLAAAGAVFVMRRQ